MLVDFFWLIGVFAHLGNLTDNSCHTITLGSCTCRTVADCTSGFECYNGQCVQAAEYWASVPVPLPSPMPSPSLPRQQVSSSAYEDLMLKLVLPLVIIMIIVIGLVVTIFVWRRYIRPTHLAPVTPQPTSPATQPTPSPPPETVLKKYAGVSRRAAPTSSRHRRDQFDDYVSTDPATMVGSINNGDTRDEERPLLKI